MSTDNFFSNFDKKMGEIKQKEKQPEKLIQEDMNFLEEVVKRLTSQVVEYEAGLCCRNIQVETTITKFSILFILKYANGESHGIKLRRLKDNRIEIISVFTNKGKEYESAPAKNDTYDHTNWRDEIFISAIERCLNEFLLSAPSQGGI